MSSTSFSAKLNFLSNVLFSEVNRWLADYGTRGREMSNGEIRQRNKFWLTGKET